MNQWIHVKPLLHNINIDKAENDPISDRRSKSQHTSAIGNSESKTQSYTLIPSKTTAHEDADKLTQRQAYNRRAKLHLRYINHPGKIAQLGLTTRPVVLKMDCSTDVSSCHGEFSFNVVSTSVFIPWKHSDTHLVVRRSLHTFSQPWATWSTYNSWN